MKNRKSIQWARLDNVAKLYASVSSKRDPKVFRFSCELFEEVDIEILKNALAQTLVYFPLFRSVLRRGLFWYFLEHSEIEPVVCEENRPVCSPIYDRRRRNLLFSVTFFSRRINLEVFHVLSDGTGALAFFRMLIYYYLAQRYAADFSEGLPPLDFDASDTGKAADSFAKYYEGAPMPRKMHIRRAAHPRNVRLPDYRIRAIGAAAPFAELNRQAKAHNTTLTIFLSAVLMCAISEDLSFRERRRPVVLTIPVNLRNYFESQSMRNFFSVFHAEHRFQKNKATLEELIAEVTACFERELTDERLSERINSLTAIEYNAPIRMIPLIMKDIGLSISNRLSERGVTGGVSNLGRVVMPEPLSQRIRQFDVFLSTTRVQLCICGYNDTVTLNFTSPFVSTDIPRRFFRTLTKLGVPVTVSSNHLELDDEEEG